MKSLILFLLISSSLFSNEKQNLFQLYQDKRFAQACSKGISLIHKYSKDEQFVSLYAFSCLKADYIDRLAVPISMLKYSTEARANSAYFSVILMQKKLLYHSMIDGYDLSTVRLPSTDYVLSKVFDLYAKDDHTKKRDVYLYRDIDSPKVTYKLYIKQTSQVKKMVIEEYYDTILAHTHIYW